jgi:hypothetical protein
VENVAANGHNLPFGTAVVARLMIRSLTVRLELGFAGSVSKPGSCVSKVFKNPNRSISHAEKLLLLLLLGSNDVTSGSVSGRT